jgi:TonB family protein
MIASMKRAVVGVLGLFLIAINDVSARSKKAPVRVESPSPVYPDEMEGTGLDGHTELIFIVGEDGSVHNPIVKSATHASFGDAALEVINNWRFRPGIRDGRKVPMRVVQPFNFHAGPIRKVNALLGRVVFKDIDETIYSPAEVGGLPEIVYEPTALYPRKFQGSGQTEVIYVTMTVGFDGRGYNIEIEGYPPKDFIFPAYLAATQYRFKPVVHNDQRVYVYTRVAIVVSEDITESRLRGQGYDAPISDPEDAYPDYPDF